MASSDPSPLAAYQSAEQQLHSLESELFVARRDLNNKTLWPYETDKKKAHRLKIRVLEEEHRHLRFELRCAQDHVNRRKRALGVSYAILSPNIRQTRADFMLSEIREWTYFAPKGEDKVWPELMLVGDWYGGAHLVMCFRVSSEHIVDKIRNMVGVDKVIRPSDQIEKIEALHIIRPDEEVAVSLWTLPYKPPRNQKTPYTLLYDKPFVQHKDIREDDGGNEEPHPAEKRARVD
ncbi:MAG: hypothetical protein M1828_004120 [Chrysothrix sp. TS-e1954]|nr:MAG: hypothetical protein M1828_004120 [Chrysothrix sp. TS-e1954]